MWNRKRAAKPVPNPELVSALADLTRLARTRPELESPAATLGQILTACFASPPAIGSAYATQEPKASGIEPIAAALMPIFRHAPPDLIESDLRTRALEILRILEPENPAAKRLAGEGIAWREWCLQTLTSEESSFAAEVQRLELDLELVNSVLRFTLMPVLSMCTRSLKAILGETWAEGGLCPCCGRLPTLAESRGLDGRRFLRCGLCASEWLASRLQCVACGESDSSSLTSLFVEGDESRARLVRCATCGFRLKILSTLSRLSPPSLVVAELETIHLEFIEPR